MHEWLSMCMYVCLSTVAQWRSVKRVYCIEYKISTGINLNYTFLTCALFPPHSLRLGFSSCTILVYFFFSFFCAVVPARIKEFLNRLAQWWSLKGGAHTPREKRKSERWVTLDDVVNVAIVVSYSISKWLNFNLSSFRLQSCSLCLTFFFISFPAISLLKTYIICLHLYQDAL